MYLGMYGAFQMPPRQDERVLKSDFDTGIWSGYSCVTTYVQEILLTEDKIMSKRRDVSAIDSTRYLNEQYLWKLLIHLIVGIISLWHNFEKQLENYNLIQNLHLRYFVNVYSKKGIIVMVLALV